MIPKWRSIAALVGAAIVLNAASSSAAASGGGRVFEPVVLGASNPLVFAKPHPAGVYVASSLRTATRFKPFISDAAWKEVSSVDFESQVAVAVFADVWCPARFHIIDLARGRNALVVTGEAVYAQGQSSVGCLTSSYSAFSYEVIKVPRRVIGTPLPRSSALSVEIRVLPVCEQPPRWFLELRSELHDPQMNQARLNAAAAAAQRNGLSVLGFYYGLVWVHVEGSPAAVAQTREDDPDIDAVVADPGDPWACLGPFP